MSDVVADDLLRVAQDDLDAAELMLSTTPPQLAAAAYHAEQCAEKAVKAAIAKLGVAFMKVHNVQQLASQIPASHPYSGLAVQLVGTTPWAVVFRYSAQTTVPSAKEIRDGLAVARSLTEMVVADLSMPTSALTIALLVSTPQKWKERRMAAIWMDPATLALALAAPSPNDTLPVIALRAVSESIRQPEYDMSGAAPSETGRILHDWDGAQHVLDMMRAVGPTVAKGRLYLNAVKLEEAVASQPTLQTAFDGLLAFHHEKEPPQAPPPGRKRDDKGQSL